jgi:hypothetical protein
MLYSHSMGAVTRLVESRASKLEGHHSKSQHQRRDIIAVQTRKLTNSLVFVTIDEQVMLRLLSAPAHFAAIS